MADRISSAASAVSTPAAETTPTPAPIPSLPSTPEQSAPEPQTVATPAAATPEPDEIQFEDEPELSFDDEPAAPVAQPEPVAPQTEAQPDAKAVAELSALLKAGGIPKEVETAFMRTGRGRSILALYKSERVLRDAPNFDPATGENKGGLGYMPTPEQIKEYHRGHSDWNASLQEFSQNPQSWATNWFGPQSGQFREGVDKVLASIPQVLDQAFDHAEKTGNAQLREQSIGSFRSVFAPMLQSYLDGIYQKANNTSDPAAREQFINAARTIEQDMFGEFRDDAKLAQPKPEDIATKRMRELDEREGRLNAWQTKQATESQKAAENEIFTSIDQNLTRDVEKALSTVKAGMSERAFRAAVKDFKAEIQDAVRKNHIGWRDFNFNLSAARTSRDADARTTPVQVYQQNARQIIRARYRTVLQELATGAERQNGALRATAAAAAAQTAPAVRGGQPPAQSVIPEVKITRLPGEDTVDFHRRRLAAKLGSS